MALPRFGPGRPGYIRKLKKNGQWIHAGEIIAVFFDDLESAKKHSVVEDKNTSPLAFDKKEFNFVRFSESAESLIQEFNLDPSLFANMGLVTKSIVEAVAQEKGLIRKAPTTQWVAKSQYRQEELGLSKIVEIERLLVGNRGGIVSSLTVQLEAEGLLAQLAKISGGPLRSLLTSQAPFGFYLLGHPLKIFGFHHGSVERILAPQFLQLFLSSCVVTFGMGCKTGAIDDEDGRATIFANMVNGCFCR